MNKIFIYGNGILSATIQELIDKSKVQLLGIIIDREYQDLNHQNDLLIISPEELINYEYDYIVIASNYYDEMKNTLVRVGVDFNKIIATDIHQSNAYKTFIEQIRQEFENNFNQKKLNDLLVKDIYEYINLSHMNPSYHERNIKINNPDYVRYSSLELTANRIIEENILGDVAEVGVYRGEFAAFINELFPNRKLYLFDTFDGFSDEDVNIESRFGFSKNISNQFSDTSVELVISRMVKPENCIVKKGYFPKTTSDVDCNFAFVSLDTDLYQPIYDGLQYFYPRLSKGGVIFIHDYLNNNFKGVKVATDQFCREENVTLQILSDFYGTAVLVK